MNDTTAPAASAERPSDTATRHAHTTAPPRSINLTLVTDAWHPQVNGVVRTWHTVRNEIEAMGHCVAVVNPSQFLTFPLPRYPEIRLPIFPLPMVFEALDAQQPDAIHIATEGTLGLAARHYCTRRKLPFTTSYHTQYPHYLKKYAAIPVNATYAAMRWFHGPARATLVPTASVKRELDDRGFEHVVVWTRGVNTELFQPYDVELYPEDERPVFVYMGRVAREKNIDAFFEADLPGTKWVIGGGPQLGYYKKRYPEVRFCGYKHGRELAEHVAAADVFAFPSKTDTFGVVMLEALACGVPVAAYPVTGPTDVIEDGVVGSLDDDFQRACIKALELDPGKCRQYAEQFTWRRCAEMVVDNLALIERQASRRL